MPRHSSQIPALPLIIDQAAPTPVYRQLYTGLRDAILSGLLPAGTRLPSTRALAAAIRVARNTVSSAYEQLLAEGYVEGRIGSGTFVSHALPDELLRVRSGSPSGAPAAAGRELSRRGERLAATPVTVARDSGAVQAFRPGLPALDVFPSTIWGQLAARCWREMSPEILGYGDPAGYLPLREAIAAYLRESRGVRCNSSQIIITTGSQQGLDLAARLLLDPGDSVWVEDPGYLGARGALTSAGARLVPVPVDAEGLDVVAGQARAPVASLAYVTPSHQYPLGVTMSLPRRLALIEWARSVGAWVIEDDYDSEYRYSSRPLPALQGLDETGRIVYVGTFSKVLFPGLRLGYLVVPPSLSAAFSAARALIDRHPHTVDQAILTAFMVEGHFARHIRRTRTLYAERQAALVEAATAQLAGLLEIRPNEAGMQLVGWLPAGADDRLAAQQAAANTVDVSPLTAFVLDPTRPQDPGLLLGYAAVDIPAIRAGVARLAAALRS